MRPNGKEGGYAGCVNGSHDFDGGGGALGRARIHVAGGYRRPDGTLVEPIFTATETRKSEGTVLITQSAMERVFGAEKNAQQRYEQTALFE